MLYVEDSTSLAGTGKTKTVKNLWCTLGILIVVFNWSYEHRFLDMAKIFKSVCYSGLLGFSDEFNKISFNKFSVVAVQI